MKILITGGAGFIGINAAKRFIDKGNEVIIFDNLSRAGSARNLEWLKVQDAKFEFVKGDVRNPGNISKCLGKYGKIDVILHLAAQVAVTTSVADPEEDFEINARGTFNMLEAARNSSAKSIFLYASTNKVYGEMNDIKITVKNGGYRYKDLLRGVSEERVLDFHSPYGCSKGAGDQYVIDYARIYGLKTVTFRQSCIYGTRQFGVEDQGWVAYFIICAVLGKPITIYGDGKQTRDVLYVDDLVDCYEKAIKVIGKTAGGVYNIGGGASNVLSLLDLIKMLEKFTGKKIKYKFSAWRPGDQRTFVSDTGKAARDFGWKPRVAASEGVKRLYNWVSANKQIFK